MTPTELIANFAQLGSRQDLSVVLQYLSDHVSEARLSTEGNGERPLCDATDFMMWLEELAKAANSRMLAKPPAKVPAEQPRWGSWER